MSFLDQIGSILDQYKAGAMPSREEAHLHYDEIARTVPTDVLAQSIGPALQTMDTQHLKEKIAQAAAQMTPQQRSAFMREILGGLTAGSDASLASEVTRAGVSPSVAQDPSTATPQDVGSIAAYAKEHQPELFRRATEFYAQHPTLVKVLGTVAIASIARRLAGGARPGLI
jgi:hypothetical protein